VGVIEDFDQKAERGCPERHPRDYHDFVFRGGKLVGDFDNMYRYSSEVPWSQDKLSCHWCTEVGVLMLKDRAPYGSILEIGCGLGFIAAKLKELVRDKGLFDAFDVSPEAIRQAGTLHEGIGFYVDNIADPSFRPKRQYDLVVIKDIFWYVFDRMETTVRNINACVKPLGFLYLGQSFPALDSGFVGKEVIPNPDALLEFFSGYDPVYTALLRNHHLAKDGPVLHRLAVKAA
jgi:SAM-dependent methyltransferase